jgi:hypothetical protein
MSSKVTKTSYINYEEIKPGVILANYGDHVEEVGLAEAEVILKERFAYQKGEPRRLVLVAPHPSVEISPSALQLFGSAYGQHGLSAIAMINGADAARVQEFLDTKVEKTGTLVKAFPTVDEGIEWISSLN